MRLKELELSGFKSFAKPTTLDFPVAVSAIVGPNGSGKSNVAEAIRWVMGEQSMKSLRGKKGEDLIFNGSATLPRMGKANVILHFDNTDGKIPLDFSEVRIERKIFRDGTNEYLLNDSNVRLKDIVELMARIGLGDTKHNIIGQGEVDRWLFSSAKDRKEILEEALGLKVYQMKKIESLRKLAATEENMRQVEGLLREIGPHLTFLKHQAEKAQMQGTLEAELRHLEKVYFARTLFEIENNEELIARNASPIERELRGADDRVKTLLSQIEKEEAAALTPGELRELEKEVAALEEKSQQRERDFGRLEGRLSLERERLARPIIKIVDANYVKEKLSSLLHFLRPERSSGDPIAHLTKAVADLESLLRDLEKGSVEVPVDESSRQELKKLEMEHRQFDSDLKETRNALRAAKTKLQERDAISRRKDAELRRLERDLRGAEEVRAAIRSKLERTTYDRENIISRREELKKELVLAELTELHLREVPRQDVEAHENLQELFKKIERIRGKLEEIGGIDAAVVKEYQDTEARNVFLTKELNDLKEAGTSLQELIETLEKQIGEDFDRGFKKVNEGFDQYFKIIFGGGRAKLIYQKLGRRGAENEEDTISENEEEAEYGIDIDVDIPRKRIKSLSMLSGGERALTSIALLFAMVSVNPPPFLVLDETDAALDEANSQKYANTLAELAKKTQLIIITHNRETMMRSGILYGVTMGDDGISKLISIKLEEGEKYVNR